MYSTRTILIFLFLIAGIKVEAQYTNPAGIPIAYWDFENNTTRTTLETTVEQAMNTGCTFDGKFGGASTTTCQGAGNGVTYGGTAAGSALTASGWSTSIILPTSTYFQFTINTTGMSGISFLYDTYTGSTLTNRPDVNVYASYDGGANFSSVSSPLVTTNTWQTWFVSLPASANNLSNLKIRIYGSFSNNSASCGADGYMRIDNLAFFASALVASAGTKTTLNELNIYTSYTSGNTGSLYIRYGTFTVNSGATLNLGAQLTIGSATLAGAMNILSGGTFDCGNGTNQILNTVTSGLATFTLNPGATIIIRSVSGLVAAPTLSGNIRTTTRTYSAGANYVYTHISGTAMVTGDGLPAALTGSLTIANTNAVTLSQATALNSPATLFLTTGSFSNGALLTMNNGTTINRDGGSLAAAPVFNPTVNLIYSGATTVTSGNEIPVSTTALNNLTVSKSAGSVTLNSNCTVNGSFNQTSGTFIQNSGTNTFSLTINGDFNLSGGSYNFHSGSTQSTMTLKGNFVQTLTGATTTSGSLNGIVLFNKSGTQTFSADAPANLVWIQYNVASTSTLQMLTNMPVYGSSSFPSAMQVNGTLDAKTFTVTSQATGCTFALNANATLVSANANGVFSGTAGSVSNTFTTKTFSNNASYNFNGTVAQAANLFNPVMNNLTINNTAGVTLTSSTNPVVNGTLSLTAGPLVMGTNLLTLSGPVTTTSGTLSGSTTSDLTINNTGAITGNVSFTTGALQVNNFLLNRTGTTFTLGTALSVSGNWTNNGTFNANAKTITFNGSSGQTISGSGATAFAALTINAGTSIATVVDATGAGGGLISNTSTLTLTNGLYRLSAANATAFRSGSLTIAATAGLEVNGGSFTENAGTMTVNGLFRIISGSASVGNASGNALDCSSTGTVDLQGGTLAVAARMRNIGGDVFLSGTTVSLNTVGLSNASRAVFEMDGASDFAWSAGTIVLQNVNASSGGEINLAAGAGVKNVSGGTLQTGNASTPSGQTFRCNSAVDFYNFTVNSTNTPNVSLQTNNLTVKNMLTLNGGLISTGSLSVIIPLGGNVTRTAGHVNGNLRKSFASGSGQSATFETGDAAVYAPVQLSNLDVTVAGDVSAITVAGNNPNENNPVSNASGINQGARANRYWTLTPSGGFALSSTDAAFNFSASEATGNPLNYVVRKFDAGAWTTTGAGTMSATSSQGTGITSLNEFEAGEANAVPGVTCPSDLTQCDNNIATWTTTPAGSPAPDVVCTPASGSVFATGTTAVNCTATNINGSSGCSFNVNIYTSPVIGACPSDFIQCDNHVVNYSPPSATGLPSASVNCSPASGSIFATGTTAVTCTVANSCGTSSCAFNVTIQESPVIASCPSDITQCDNHVVSFTTPAASGSPAASVNCSPTSGSTFATGTTAVTCTASNVCGTSTCSFNITVQESPVISACPGNITQCDNTIASWTNPAATGSPTAAVVCSPASGSTFSIGTTAVTCTATNSCGTSSCSFNVTVNLSSAAASGISTSAAYGQICLGGSVTLGVIGGSLGTGASWEWYEGSCGGTGIASGSSVSITPATSGMHTYYVRAEGTCGPTTCQSISVNVITAPPAGVVSYTSTLADGCVGSPAASISVNAVPGAAFYRWTSAQAGVRFNGNPSPYETTVPTVNLTFVSLPAAGTSGWSICVFGGNACGNTNTICSWVRAIVGKPAAINGSVIGCPGATGQPYSSAYEAGATSYIWSSTGGIVISNNGSQNITVDFSGAFVSGTLSVHAQTGCGYNSADRTITITRAPAIPGIINGASYPCPNASSSYSVAPVPGAASYTWTTSVPGALVTGTTNTCSIAFPATIPAGATVSVTANSSCPFSSAVRSKGIASGVPGVPAAINGPAAGQCGQTGVSYSVSPVALATSYSWSTGCGSIIGPTNLSGITVDWPANFAGCVLSVSAINSCGIGIPRTLSVLGAPGIPATITGNAAPCAGTVEFYSTVGSAGATSYIWTVPAAATILGPSNGSSILVQWDNAGGNITVRGSNTCGNSGLRSLSCVMACRMNQLVSSGSMHAELYPNPAAAQSTLKFHAPVSGVYDITMQDATGRIVYQTTTKAEPGENVLEFDFSLLAKGLYLMNVSGQENAEQLKVIIQ